MSRHAQHLARIMPLMRNVVSHLGVQSTPTGKRLGLSNTRMGALAVALDSPGLPMSELAASLDLPASLATRTADELVERGLMERFADPTDRRRVRVRATPAGHQAFDDVHSEAAVLIGNVLERMSTEQVDALILGLEALLEAMHDTDSAHTHHSPRSDT